MVGILLFLSFLFDGLRRFREAYERALQIQEHRMYRAFRSQAHEQDSAAW
jgi:hypothetical protein